MRQAVGANWFVASPPLILLDMRKDVQDIFVQTPREKQVLMFSATLSKEIRPICKKFMQKVWPRVSNVELAAGNSH